MEIDSTVLIVCPSVQNQTASYGSALRVLWNNVLGVPLIRGSSLPDIFAVNALVFEHH